MASTLLHSPAQIVRKLLVDLGVASEPNTSSAWPAYHTNEPNEPDNVVTVFDTVGTNDGRSMIDGEIFNHPGFQVRVRAKDHSTGWVKADAIQTELAENCLLRTVTVDSSRYRIQAVTRIGDVLALGRQVPHSMRSIFTFNATLALDQVA